MFDVEQQEQFALATSDPGRCPHPGWVLLQAEEIITVVAKEVLIEPLADGSSFEINTSVAGFDLSGTSLRDKGIKASGTCTV